MDDFCVKDTHGIWFACFFDVEDHELAQYFYKRVVDGLTVTTFTLNGVLLENEYTALKRTAVHPDPHYVW